MSTGARSISAGSSRLAITDTTSTFKLEFVLMLPADISFAKRNGGGIKKYKYESANWWRAWVSHGGSHDVAFELRGVARRSVAWRGVARIQTASRMSAFQELGRAALYERAVSPAARWRGGAGRGRGMRGPRAYQLNSNDVPPRLR